MEKILHTYVVLAYKQSVYLEDCIKSVLNQKYKSKVVIGTSTPNDYIKNLAKKYNIEMITNEGKKGIGFDFDFAIKCSKTPLVTIAHQDDIYDYNYSEEVVKKYKEFGDSLIIFSDYYEIRGEDIVNANLNLRLKRFLLRPLKNPLKADRTSRKRRAIKFGCSICCPAVTFNVKNISFPIYESCFRSNVDWNAWERLSRQKGRFIFIKDRLMGHRIHEESTTSLIINDNKRSREDYIIFKKFWIKPIAFILSKIYSLSEKSNGKTK